MYTFTVEHEDNKNNLPILKVFVQGGWLPECTRLTLQLSKFYILKVLFFTNATGVFTKIQLSK